MKIRQAKNSDFNEYLKLKREEEKDYSEFIGKKIPHPKDTVLKKEFKEALSSKNHVILVIERNNRLIGYIHGMYYTNPYSKWGYVEDIFVLKDFRRKGIATALVKEFIKILKKKGYNKLRLSVNTKNFRAIKFYKKLGFEISHYDMKKDLKKQ